MHVIVHMFTGDLCRFSLIHCFMLFITSPLVVCADFHSRAQGRARIRKGGVFRAQHGCDTLAWSEPSSYTGAVKQWRWRSFIYFFTNISHVIPHVIYVKTLKLSLGRSLCTRQDLGCPPMCGHGQGFVTKRETFRERGIILHTSQVETSTRAPKLLAMESSSHTCLYIVSSYALYDLIY